MSCTPFAFCPEQVLAYNTKRCLRQGIDPVRRTPVQTLQNISQALIAISHHKYLSFFPEPQGMSTLENMRNIYCKKRKTDTFIFTLPPKIPNFFSQYFLYLKADSVVSQQCRKKNTFYTHSYMLERTEKKNKLKKDTLEKERLSARAGLG